MTDTEARVAAIVRKKVDQFPRRRLVGVDLNIDANFDATLIDDLRLDSLDMIEFIMACEEEFGIEISDDEAELANRQSVRQWCAFLDARLTAKAVLGSVAA